MHEMMGDFMHDRLNTHGPLFFSWVICGSAFVAAMTVAYAPFLWRLPLRTRLSFLVAGALYVGGTLGMDVVQGPYAEQHGQYNMTFSMMATVEEVMEMSGVLVFIEALLAHLKNLGGRSCFRIVD